MWPIAMTIRSVHCSAMYDDQNCVMPQLGLSPIVLVV